MSHYSKAALRITCLVSSTLLLLRTCAGPITGIVSARSTLNIAAFAFLSFIGLLLIVSIKNDPIPCTLQIGPPPRKLFLYPILAFAAITPYLVSLNTPFLFDDYVHLTNAAAAQSLPATLHKTFLEHPQGGDGFFRPLGMLYYWFTFQWAGWNPAVWHVTGLLIHAANTLLLYIFLNRVFSLTIPALAGSLLFAWHASHVEAICWTAASFDLLAAFFSLLTLLQATDFRAKRFQTATIMLTAVFACLSKESAYCLPLIVADLPGSTEAHNAAACF